MVVYYRKLMGNGMVASKFRLVQPAADAGAAPDLPVMAPIALETAGSHHESNCVRCYKLKKKCSRTYPHCDYCLKSGTECQYVDRKRKKLRQDDEPAADRRESAPTELLLAFLIASLVHRDETEELFHNIELPSAVAAAPAPEKRPDVRRPDAKPARPFTSITKRMVALAVEQTTRLTLSDEFLVVQPIADDSLPSAFVHTFFANYEWKYPFLERGPFVGKVAKMAFTHETLVNLDVYLVMAVGCIVYDANHNTRHYREYFSDLLIESIVGVISYDIRLEEDLHTAHLLILLCIYAVNVSNTNLVWNIVGFLNRLIIFLTDFTGRHNQCMRKRCFWTIFNLDKELSLMLDKLLQFMPTRIIKLDADFSDTLSADELATTGLLMAQAVALHTLQDRMLSLQLGLADRDAAAFTAFSADLETWRVAMLLLIHKEYAELPLLENFIGLVNLDYYYLLIELDQVSSTESFQFTLQFLLNSFSLLLSELTLKKGVVGTSLYSLFWFVKFFKVVEYNLASLLRILDGNVTKGDLSMRLSDFNSNMQLVVNLLKFLIDSRHRPEQFLDKLKSYVKKLTALNVQLVGFSPLTADKAAILAVKESVDSILEH